MSAEIVTLPTFQYATAPLAERAALGAILLDPAGQLPKVLRALRSSQIPATSGDHAWERIFADPQCCVIFDSILRLADSAKQIDPITVATELESRGELEDAGGCYFIARLEGDVATLESTDTYCRQMIEAATKRATQAAAFDLLESTDTDPNAYLESTIDRLESYRPRPMDDSHGTMEERGGEFVDILDAKTRGEATIRSPWESFNRLAGGFRSGKHYGFGGRYKAGKTTLGLNAAFTTARKLQKSQNAGCVVFFSAEMPARDLTFWIISMRTGVNTARWEDSPLPGDMHMVADKAWRKHVQPLPLRIIDKTDIGVVDIRDSLLRIAEKQPIHLVVIDYLQKLRAPRPPKGQNVTTEWTISRNVNDLEDLAHSGDIDGNPCIISLVQEIYDLHEIKKQRDPSQRSKMQVASPRDARAIIGAVDLYAVFDRADIYSPDEFKDCSVVPATLTITDIRGGSTGKCDLDFHKTCALILDEGATPEFG